ncbi:heme A synthase [Anaplasma phagocytophilum]|nr:heme A synthase [Anaplasma phagocytophilum]
MRTAHIATWLGTCCIMVLLMVFVGGVTRLTNSGLSITEWRPVTGVLPPISDADWAKEHEKYAKTPEYLYINSGISLSDFKRIYMTEYVHRLLGRILGIIFFVPMLYFAVKRQIKGALATRLGIVALLGALQGAMGWFMVKSGLVDVPYVSHFRLAAHLFLTIVLFSLLWHSFLESRGVVAVHKVTYGKYIFAIFMLVITGLQMVLGALVAGLDAGLIFNTFPLMDGDIIPSQILSGELLTGKFLYNAVVVQFLHRFFATVVLVSAVAIPLLMRFKESWMLCFGIVLQFLFGVATLVHGVPLYLASLHQIWSFVVVALEVYILKVIRKV